jgi:hypothetical protein
MGERAGVPKVENETEAYQSKIERLETIRALIDEALKKNETGELTPPELAKVNSEILRKVIEWWGQHKDEIFLQQTRTRK